TRPEPSSTASSGPPTAGLPEVLRQASAQLATPLLGLALLALAVGAMLVGPYPITPGAALGALGDRLAGAVPAGGWALDTVLFFARLPRVGAALLIGAALAAAGASYQGLFRNPLVSPDILGVSAGAGLGAVLGIFLSLPVALIQLLAFLTG